MDKTFSPSYSSSQINYVEAEAVEFSRFPFHRKRTASTASASSFRFHIADLKFRPEKPEIISVSLALACSILKAASDLISFGI